MRRVVRLLLSGVILSLLTGGPGQAVRSQTDETRIPGINEEVSIHFDAYGVPQIIATSSNDLFVGQGYVHAAQRWWQLEWARHQGHGRLAELAGPGFVEQDRLMRTLRLSQLASAELERLPDDSRQMLEAYTQGINNWLNQQPDEYPAWEYDVLAEAFGDTVDIEPWTVHDTLVLQYLVGWRFNQFSMLTELLKSEVVEVAGPLVAAIVLPDYPYDAHPVVMDPSWQPNHEESSTSMSSVKADLPTNNPITNHSVGSNAWVVSGTYTTSGLPLLANDSHLGIQLPSFWYENGLHCVEVTPDCPYRVYGFSIVGAPGVMAGHNQHLGWGFTSAQTDLGDFYRLEINPENPLQYRYQDSYLDMETSSEIIMVRGGEPVTIDVRRTRFGPVIEQFSGLQLDSPLALHWAAFDGHRGVQGVLAINQAVNWEEFQAGIALFDIAAFNVIYADVDGNIGYILTGRIPIRAEGYDGSLPADGFDDTFLWEGYLDQLDNPRLFNPDAGLIYSSNNAIIRPEEFDHPLATFYDYGYRAARVGTLLATDETHSVESFKAIQLDRFNSAAPAIMPVLADIDFENPEAIDLVEWLQQWDYQDEPDSPHAALFNVFLDHLIQLALEELPAYEQSHTVYLLSQMMAISVHPLWQSQEMDISGRDAILEAALLTANDDLVARWGTDRSQWRWGELHPAVFELEIVPVIEELTGTSTIRDIAAYEIALGGGLTSPNVAPWSPSNTDQRVTSIPGMRFIVDFSDFDQSLFVNSTGQSDNPNSPYFTDQIPLWAAGSYRQQHFELADIPTFSEFDWQLVPARN